MTSKTEIVSRETTTTKPDRTDINICGFGRDKPTDSNALYGELKEWIEERDRFLEMRDDIDRTLGGINEEINKRVETILKDGIDHPKYVLTGVTMKKRRTVNPSWFRQNRKDVFLKLATVDGKSAIRLIANEKGGMDAARQFLRDLDPEFYDANASFTIADITKIYGTDAVDEFEVAGGFNITQGLSGEARLVSIRPEVD